MQGRNMHTRRQPRRRMAAVASVAAGAFIVGVAIAPSIGLASGRDRSVQSFGRIPQAAVTRTGINWSIAPDYIAVLKRGVVVGYVAKAALDQSEVIVGPRNGGTFTPSHSSVLNVVNRSLRLVGHFYPMIGFVPNNESSPPPGVTPTTVYGPPITSGDG
jgi:hypothetical protein